jgi:hypothetical protein
MSRKEEEGARLGAFIAVGITEAGTVRKTASVNHILTETVDLQRPPRLISINRGGWAKLTASVNGFLKAVTLSRPPWLMAY